MKRKLYMVLGVTMTALLLGCGIPDDDDDDDFGPVTQIVAVDGEYVIPGAPCRTRGATGKAKNGLTYTCKTSPLSNRLLWRL